MPDHELQTSVPALAGRKRKAKALKINLKKVSGNKQDKVFAIYFKNDTLNKSETDFSQNEKTLP